MMNFFEKNADASSEAPAKKITLRLKELWVRHHALWLLVIVIVPIFFCNTFLTYEEVTRHKVEALAQKEKTVSLVADFMTERFERTIDVGTVITTRPLFQELVKAGKWDEALRFAEESSKVFPYIDSMGLFDPLGILKATTSKDPSSVGRDLSSRDYYQGVSKDWQPYVSEAFNRLLHPQYRLIAVAVPVKDRETVLGILVIGVRPDVFLEWFKEFGDVPEGLLYLVDKKGQVVVSYPPFFGEEIKNFSTVPVVPKVLNGESGTDIVFDPIEEEERVFAYRPLPHYGFGVVIEQSARVVFEERDRAVVQLILVFVGAASLLELLFYFVLRGRARLKDQRDRERAFLENIGEGVIALAKDRTITLINSAACKLTGWSKEEAVGKPYREVFKVVRERDRVEDSSFVEEAFVFCRTTSAKEDMILIRKDGTEIIIGDSVAPVCDARVGVSGGIIAFRDISQERETLRLRSDLTYASHQLRTPVTEATWNLETAMIAKDPEKRQELLWNTQKSLISIKELTENLITVAEIDQEAVVVKKSAIRVSELVPLLERELDIKMKKYNVRVAFSVPSGMQEVVTDLKILLRIFSEVIENAVIHSNEGSLVQVTVRTQDGTFVVEVVDTGRGIPEDEQPLIFTKFFRGSNRPSGSAGSGLGLYIAREYARLLGGKIWFTSKEGVGTTFYISMPIK